MALFVVASWIGAVIGLFLVTKPFGPQATAASLLLASVISWSIAEVVGIRKGLVWPTSALAITGSLSLGFAVSLAIPETASAPPATAIAIISGTAALSMAAHFMRFRLPGLVSPIMTFSIVALFLLLYGVDQNGLSRVEGFSPRGILAALMGSPAWMAVFGVLGTMAVAGARWLDLNANVLGVASARPLHIVGAGVLTLVVGRVFATFPHPVDLGALVFVAVIAFPWSLRINRVAVLVAIHFAIAKPMLLALIAPLDATMSLTQWSVILCLVLITDLVLWPFLHHISLRRGWTLGPGGRIPQPRKGWLWRYWPYA